MAVLEQGKDLLCAHAHLAGLRSGPARAVPGPQWQLRIAVLARFSLRGGCAAAAYWQCPCDCRQPSRVAAGVQRVPGWLFPRHVHCCPHLRRRGGPVRECRVRALRAEPRHGCCSSSRPHAAAEVARRVSTRLRQQRQVALRPPDAAPARGARVSGPELEHGLGAGCRGFRGRRRTKLRRAPAPRPRGRRRGKRGAH